MKNKETKIKIGASISVLVSLFVILFCLSNIFFKKYDFKQKVKRNTISVTVENLDIDKVTIELVDFPNSKVVLKNGNFNNYKNIGKIKNGKDSITFNIFYDNLLITNARIFTTHEYYPYDFFFNITKKDSTLDFRFNVIGNSNKSFKYSKIGEYKLVKELQEDSLRYIYRTIKDEEVVNEIITVKK